jgi:hypothetical protein
MHSQNPASHPELLEELAEAVVESGYDVRHLTQAIVLSNVYARTAQDSEEQPRSPDLFAVSVPRPLTPRQLSLSLRIAGQNPEKLQDMKDNDSWSVEREKLEKASEGIARKLLIPTEGFQVPVTEALWFSNNLSLQKDLLSTSKDRLVGYLQTLETDDEVVSAAFASILNRTADAAEKIAIENYLAEREDRRDDALKQVVWALLATPEFRFNH